MPTQSLPSCSPRQLPVTLRALDRWVTWAPGEDAPNPLDPGDRVGGFLEAAARHASEPGSALLLAMNGGIRSPQSSTGASILALVCKGARRSTGELEPWFRELWTSCGNSYAEIGGPDSTVVIWIESTARGLLGSSKPFDDDDGGSFTVGNAGTVRLYGLGEPSLLNVTCRPIPGGYGELAIVRSLELRQLFPGLRGLDPIDLPRLALRVRKHPAGRALLAGSLEGFPGAAGSTPEDLWRWLVRLTRESCDGDLGLAAQLLGHSPLGRIRTLADILEAVNAPPELETRAPTAPTAARANGHPSPTPSEAPKPTPKPKTLAAPAWKIDPVQSTPEELPLHELFAGLLPARGLARLVGESGAGKSTLALALAAHAALGLDFGRHRCARVGVVAYIVNEGHHGFGLRWRALARELGPERAAAARILRVEGPVALSHGGTVQAFGEQLLEAARTWTQEPRPFSLLVVDTQAGSLGDLCENANDHMQRLAHNLLALGAQLGALVLLVHHAHRSGGRARGASAISNAVDAELFLELRGRRRILRTAKTRDGAALEQALPIELRVVELGADPAGVPVRTVVAAIDEREPDTSEAPERSLDAEGFLERANGTGRGILEFFRAAGDEGSRISRRDLAHRLNLPDGTTKALLEAAVRLELLETDPPRRGIAQRRTLTPKGRALLAPSPSSASPASALGVEALESGLGDPYIP